MDKKTINAKEILTDKKVGMNDFVKDARCYGRVVGFLLSGELSENKGSES
jgi:hypothetical protein